MQLHVGRTFALCLHKMAVHGGSIPYSEAVGSCEDHGSTALQIQVLDSDGGLSPMAAMTVNVAWITLLPAYVLG